MQKDATELRWILSVIRRWLWLIVGCVLLGTISAFLVTSRMPPVYSASVTLLVRVDAETSMSEYTALLASEQLALTYSQMLKGRPVLEAVIARLEMQTTPEILAKKSQCYTSQRHIPDPVNGGAHRPHPGRAHRQHHRRCLYRTDPGAASVGDQRDRR